MKRSKKFYVSLTAVALCVLALLVWRFLCLSRAWCLGGATLCYEENGEIVSVELEWGDWVEISGMFNLNFLEENRYRCPVSESLCIKTGTQTFYIAGDGCDLVHIAGTDRCFETGERDRLWEILKEYGVKH